MIQTSQLSRFGCETHDFKVNLTTETKPHDFSRRAQIRYSERLINILLGAPILFFKFCFRAMYGDFYTCMQSMYSQYFCKNVHVDAVYSNILGRNIFAEGKISRPMARES